jgi:hypothetical protein
VSDTAWVATRKGLFKISSDSGSWEIAGRFFLGDNVNVVAVDRENNRVYVSLDHGHFGTKFHRSDDGGENWTEVACPEYPEQPEGWEETPNPFTGKVAPWSLEQIWSIVPAANGILWCGTIPGGLFKSEDCGESWTMVRSLWDLEERRQWMGAGMDYAGIHSICVDPRDPDHLTVGVSIGGVYVSHDGGDSWEVKCSGLRAEYMPPDQAEDPAAQDPHLIAHCVADPDTIWIQHHNGVFVTRNGCDRWEDISDIDPSTFGFAVAVHPNDGDTAWLVPGVKDELRYPVDGALVVTRTRDGGKSWEKLSKGLPQVDAYDLVFRHALVVDETGDRLIFGTTTGNLWVSEDGGDGWEQVSAKLPPVYCVAWV